MMINKPQLAILLLFTFSSFVVNAQKDRLIGLWEVVRVEVGPNNMTPVAKWTRINADGTFQSGNGWLQSSNGEWQFDNASNLYTSSNPLDVNDEFGGFKVSFEKENMHWEREEEGMLVHVFFRPIETLPMSPADYLEGAWDLVDIKKEEVSILAEFDRDNQHRMLIRWDRIYVSIDPEGNRSTGYWHIHGHRPEITFLSHSEGKEPERWRVEVTESQMVLTGISEEIKLIQRVYHRKDTF